MKLTPLVKTVRLARVKPASTRFRDRGRDQLETINSLIRGALVARLDEMYVSGRLGELLGRDSPRRDIREHGLRMFQELMASLFPAEFIGPEEEHLDVVPAAGPRRVGDDRLLVWARLNGYLNDAAPGT